MTCGPPMTRRSAPSSRTAHSFGGFSRCRISWREILRLGAAVDLVFRRQGAQPDDRAGVVLDLQQAGDELQLVLADEGGGGLKAEVRLDPVRQDVRVPLPPAGRVGFPGQVEQRLALRRRGPTPYRVSRSAMSRSLNPTRPCSMRLIFECEPRMLTAARSVVMPASSRRRRRWPPSTRRCTVGPAERGLNSGCGVSSQAESSGESIATPRWLASAHGHMHGCSILPCDHGIAEEEAMTIASNACASHAADYGLRVTSVSSSRTRLIDDRLYQRAFAWGCEVVPPRIRSRGRTRRPWRRPGTRRSPRGV